MTTNLTNLSVDERIRLVQDLWHSIAADASKVQVPAEQLAEVRGRLAQYRVDGDRGLPVREIVDRIRNEL